jgi:hypothetical protein
VLAAPYRYRVALDPEGWPMIPGPYGRLEWHDGREVTVHTDRPRDSLGVGDQEVRGLFSAAALPAVVALIRARRRRAGHPAGPRDLVSAPRHSATSAA